VLPVIDYFHSQLRFAGTTREAQVAGAADYVLRVRLDGDQRNVILVIDRGQVA
jgi:hypothetical protein